MKEMREDEKELLAYLVTSAAGLSGEPAYYGQLRLLDAAGKYIRILQKNGNQNAEELEQVQRSLLEARKCCGKNDAGFSERMQKPVLQLLDLQ